MSKVKSGFVEPEDDGPVTRDEAKLAVKHMLAYLSYQGGNKEYLQKAKVGAVLVGSYVKHYGSQTNREALRLAFQKRELQAGD